MRYTTTIILYWKYDVAFEEKSVVAPAEEQFDDIGYPTQAKPVKPIVTTL